MFLSYGDLIYSYTELSDKISDEFMYCLYATHKVPTVKAF